MVLIPEKPF